MTIDINDIQAGDYQLIVDRWDETTSEVGKPREFTVHRRGAKLTLNQSEARRLVLAGAVRPWSERNEDLAALAKPDDGPSRRPGGDSEDAGPAIPTTPEEILADVGDHPGKALEYFEAEKAKGDDADQALLAQLHAIATATPAPDPTKTDPASLAAKPGPAKKAAASGGAK